MIKNYNVCPRSLGPIYAVYIKWVKTSWTHSIYDKESCYIGEVLPWRAPNLVTANISSFGPQPKE